MTFTTFTDLWSCDSLEFWRLLIAVRTIASLGTGDVELNSSFVMTSAEPIVLVKGKLGVAIVEFSVGKDSVIGDIDVTTFVVSGVVPVNTIEVGGTLFGTGSVVVIAVILKVVV